MLINETCRTKTWKIIQSALIWFLFTVLSLSAAAQDKFQLSWYYSAADTIGIEQAAGLPFIPLDQAYKTPPLFNTGTYWFKLTITAKQPAETRIIQILNPHLDTVYLYHENEGAMVPAAAGNNFKKENPAYLRYTQFTIPGDWEEVYFKTSFKKDAVFPLKIASAASFSKSEQLNFFRLGLYYGFVLMVLAVNVFFYFIFRDLKYIYYCIFLFFIAFTLAYSDGLFVLISRNAWWLNNADMLVHVLVVSAGAVFATSFLEIASIYPKAKWVGASLVLLMLISYAFHLSFGGSYYFLAGKIAGLSGLAFYWFAGIFRFKQDVFARFFVFAYGLILAFAFDFYLAGKLGWNFLNMSPNELKIASIIEMIVLSWAITYRVKLLHKEHRHYQKEINRYMQQAFSEERENRMNNEADNEDVFERVKQKFNLSERELQVLRGITEGLTNNLIAEQLFLSANTVKFHVRKIYDKMEISSRAEAVSKLHES